MDVFLKRICMLLFNDKFLTTLIAYDVRLVFKVDFCILID
jgi:hypothetical protein